LPARIVTLLVAFLAVAAGVAFLVVHYFLSPPPTVDYTAGVTADTGATVNVVLQEDPQNTVSSHPDWVSYFIQDPSTHQWVHTTSFKVPAGSKIDMTILGYDGSTPVRNQVWGRVSGTIGDVAYYGRVPVRTVNGWNGPFLIQHTFAIPGLDLNVPVQAGPGTCTTGPCTGKDHSTTTFSFVTPAQPGAYRWQCFIPCGLSFLYGNGGPMQTIGYMTGNMQVVS